MSVCKCKYFHYVEGVLTCDECGQPSDRDRNVQDKSQTKRTTKVKK